MNANCQFAHRRVLIRREATHADVMQGSNYHWTERRAQVRTTVILHKFLAHFIMYIGSVSKECSIINAYVIVIRKITTDG